MPRDWLNMDSEWLYLNQENLAMDIEVQEDGSG